MEEYQEHSLSGRVFHSLREKILNGYYKENEELREAFIGSDMGVSRTPVREALRQLELEGLVKIIPNKGACVTGISEKDVKDIYSVRATLEGLCARWATQNITKEQLERLEEVILLSEFHLNQPEATRVVRLDGTFHEILYEASNSRILEHVLSNFHRYVQVARKTSVETKDRAKISIEEHRKILEAVKAKDADAAERLANAHIAHVIENLHNQEYGEL